MLSANNVDPLVIFSLTFMRESTEKTIFQRLQLVIIIFVAQDSILVFELPALKGLI